MPQWIGCYTDDSTRNFDDGPHNNGHTIDMCLADDECKDKAYIALQNGGECFCGNILQTDPKYEKVADDQCGSPCTGETSDVAQKYCGGFYKNAVYRNPNVGESGSRFPFN